MWRFPGRRQPGPASVKWKWCCKMALQGINWEFIIFKFRLNVLSFFSPFLQKWEVQRKLKSKKLSGYLRHIYASNFQKAEASSVCNPDVGQDLSGDSTIDFLSLLEHLKCQADTFEGCLCSCWVPVETFLCIFSQRLLKVCRGANRAVACAQFSDLLSGCVEPSPNLGSRVWEFASTIIANLNKTVIANLKQTFGSEEEHRPQQQSTWAASSSSCLHYHSAQ